MPIMTD